MSKVSLGTERNIRKKFLLIILIAALFQSQSPAYAESWKDMAEKATKDYADEKAADFVQEALQGQLDTQLKKLEMKLGKDNIYVKTLRSVSTNSPELNEIAKDLASGDRDKVDKARGKMAVEFGKALSSIAKESSSGKKALDSVLGNVKGISEISTALGSSSGGDPGPALEMLGTKFLELTPMGQVVGFCQSAYGVMKWGKDKFVDSELEDLYKEFKSSNFDEKTLRESLPVAPYAGLVYDRMKELRNQKEEELGYFKGELSPEMREKLLNVEYEEVIDEMISTMKARSAKEIADAANEEKRGEAKREAETILETLSEVEGFKYGRNWENQVTLDEETLKKFIDSVKALQKENKDLDINLAAQLQAYRLVYGLGSEEYQKKLDECDRLLGKKPVSAPRPKQISSPGKIISTKGTFISRGTILGGTDHLGFANCLCRCACSQKGWACGSGVACVYSADPRGDCLCAGLGEGHEPVSGSGPCYDGCAREYKITGMKSNKTPLSPVNPVGDNTIMPGDLIRTTGETIILLQDGSRLLVKPGSILNFTSAEPGKTKVNLLLGGIRTVHAGASGQKVQIKNWVVRTKGTEFICQWDGINGKVAVVEGSVSLSNETSEEKTIESGKQIVLPQETISDYNLSEDDGGLVAGIPLRDLPLDDSQPEPFGDYEPSFAGGVIPEDWLWQDPGSDAKLNSSSYGGLVVTVPDGNEFWGYPGTTAGQRSEAPRILHKVTGDFDLQGEVYMDTKAKDIATVEFLLYSPGSHLGIKRDQMKQDLLGEHYMMMGGGWLRAGGLNKLPVLNRPTKVIYRYSAPLASSPDAPDKPILLKLTRRGNVWRTYHSLDGENWILSSREEINASRTIWAGWVFKRFAYDGLSSLPSIVTLENVRLNTAESGTLPIPEWDMVLQAGSAEIDGNTVRLQLDGSGKGTTGVHKGTGLAGDFDATVSFQAENKTLEHGESHSLALVASSANGLNRTYISWIHSWDHVAQLYMDLYAHDYCKDWNGKLRIVRQSDNISIYYWKDGDWTRLGDIRTGFPDPAYIGMEISNELWATADANASMTAEFTVDEIIGNAASYTKTEAETAQTETSADSGEKEAGASIAVPESESKVIYDTWNTGIVDNNPTCSPFFTISEPQMITYIGTYHWNHGKGAPGGTISLRNGDGTIYGPWEVETMPTQDQFWIAHPNEILPAGFYTIEDSDPATWSQNSESPCGFAKVMGVPKTSGEVTEAG